MCISQQRGAHKGDEDIARPQSPQGANLHNELSSPFAEVMFGFEKICYNQMQICSFVLIAESVWIKDKNMHPKGQHGLS